MCAGFLGVLPSNAEPLSATVRLPPLVGLDYFKLGTTRSPDGHVLSVDSQCLRLDGKPWLPVMGEFHYARYPENEWRDELLKMKAGGINIVSTYVFWIHHEEIEGQFDWSGRRSLRRFIETCRDVGLNALVRCGPWCHGEVRNGGLPDWVVERKDWRTRSTDPKFLAKVKILYGEISEQLHGLLWKDGGPVIGIQLDNEYHGQAAYLVALKQIAREVGLDVPFYTKTGWPATTTPVPLGELLPMYGTYADGFWDRNLKVMDGNKWMRFIFSRQRTDADIANDLFGKREARDDADTARYPYLTCEIGGGMETSYHRRIKVRPNDIESVALCQLGSGSVLPGYYMYHGGVNPEGKRTTLNESQATGYPNDLPVKSYDFQAPLGEYGQIHPQYHGLRRMHLFLHDYGSALAEWPTTLPDVRPTNRNDLGTLRWAVRSDGLSGLVFVNNFQRLTHLPPKRGVQFKLNLPDGEFVFPSQPVTVPSGAYFFWPFNFDLGGAVLVYATAQPICNVEQGDVRTVFFAHTTGAPAEFVFNARAVSAKAFSGTVKKQRGRIHIRNVTPGHGTAIHLKGKSGRQVDIVLLNEADSLALWKGEWQGRDRVVLSRAGLEFDGKSLRLSGDREGDLALSVFPAPGEIEVEGRKLVSTADGIFRRYKWLAPRIPSQSVIVEKVRAAGPPRTIPMSKGRTAVAVGPTESDFTNAAVWRIKLPAGINLAHDPLLRIQYAGDVARVTLDGKLLTDNFYNGNVFELGLRRHAPEIFKGDLRLLVLPLRKDAPIYMPKEAWPDFGNSDSAVRLHSVKLVNHYEADFVASD